MDSTSLPEGGEPRKCGHFHFYGLIAVVRLVRFGSIKGKWQKMRKDSRGKTVKSWQGNLLVHWSEYFSQFYDYYYGFDYNYNDYYFDVCAVAKWGNFKFL